MSAVWPVSRAAVRRRRVQTVVIGVVVLLSTTMIVVALGLLAASSGPFDQAYSRQSGAHLVASYDPSKVSDSQLTNAASAAKAYAGPFAMATVDLGSNGKFGVPQSLVTVGRADPGGPVDRLNLWKGSWADKPGQIVLNQNPTASEGRRAPTLGSTVSVAGQTLTIVGFAYSVSQSADAWVAPAQMSSLKPTAKQMLYRFAQAATNEQVTAGQSAVTSGLPSGALVGTQSYLGLRALATGEPNTFVPFLMVFGWLGLAVAVLIVANVVSGAVVAGFKHIGVLKSLGFTPTQVMVGLPDDDLDSGDHRVCRRGCAGQCARRVLADKGFRELRRRWCHGADLGGRGGRGRRTGAGGTVRSVPSLRARSLSAAEAISAGSAPRAGRGLRVQRWLAALGCPESVSLGLGLAVCSAGTYGVDAGGRRTWRHQRDASCRAGEVADGVPDCSESGGRGRRIDLRGRRRMRGQVRSDPEAPPEPEAERCGGRGAACGRLQGRCR